MNHIYGFSALYAARERLQPRVDFLFLGIHILLDPAGKQCPMRLSCCYDSKAICPQECVNISYTQVRLDPLVGDFQGYQSACLVHMSIIWLYHSWFPPYIGIGVKKQKQMSIVD